MKKLGSIPLIQGSPTYNLLYAKRPSAAYPRTSAHRGIRGALGCSGSTVCLACAPRRLATATARPPDVS